MRKSFKLEELGCANCAARMEHDINEINGVNKATINFMTCKLILDVDGDIEPILDQAQSICTRYESDCMIVR